MTDAAMITIAVGVPFAAGVAFRLALGFRAPTRAAVLMALAVVLLPLPAIVDAEHRLTRALLAILSVTIVVKLYDLHTGAMRGRVPSWRDYLVFLLSPFCLVERKLEFEPVTTRREDLHLLARGVIVTVTGGGLLAGAFAADLGAMAFTVEHIAKALALAILIRGVGAVLEGIWRLAGLRARRMFDDYMLAPTPAEFWRRWNRPVSQFFHTHIFTPLDGRHRPMLATIATFAASGAIHEYLVSMAIGRVVGLQLAFFLVQGAAVALTLRIRPSGASVAAWTFATFAFNLATTVLFFAGWNRIVPFYSEHAPAWVRGSF
jgi:hypothetical protein